MKNLKLFGLIAAALLIVSCGTTTSSNPSVTTNPTTSIESTTSVETTTSVEPTTSVETTTQVEPTTEISTTSVMPKEYVEQAISEIENYVSLSNYYVEEAREIIGLINNAKEALNGATNENEVDKIVADFKAAVDQILTINDYKEMNPVVFDADGEANWNINYKEKTYKSVTGTNTVLMFANETFEAGTIEWDMKVPTNNYAFGTLCGIVFGASTVNMPGKGSLPGEDYHVSGRYAEGFCYVTYSKEGSKNGAFNWENSNQVNITNVSNDWVHYTLQLEPEARRITIYCSNGDYPTSVMLTAPIFGDKLGLYTECADVEFKNIKIRPICYGDCNDSTWSMELNDAGETVYTCNSDGAQMMGLAGKEFRAGTIEWDMKCPSNAYNDICGVYFHATNLRTIYKVNIPGLIQDSYHTFGRWCGGDIMVGYFVQSTSIPDQINSNWENSNQINGITPSNDWQHYKVTVDHKNVCTIETSGLTATLELTVALSGKYVGFYSGVHGTQFKNLTIHEAEKEPAYNFGVGGESAWKINEEEGSYESLTGADQIMMFNELEFTGGTLEWDMKCATNNYMYATVCGMIFGASKKDIYSGNAGEDYYVFGRYPANIFVGYAKTSGAFDWENTNQINDIQADAGDNFYHYKIEWNAAENKINLHFGEASTGWFDLKHQFGENKYVGIYTESQGVVVKNIKIEGPKSPYNFGVGGESAWKINEEEGSYESLTGSDQIMMFADKEFTGGTLEWDMKCATNNYMYATVCGMIFGASKNDIYSGNPGEDYYVFGRYNANIFVGYAKTSGGFDWENTNQINDIQADAGDNFYHYKIEWNAAENKINLHFGEASTGWFDLKHQFGENKYVGIYTESQGVVIKNIQITNK